MKRQISALHHCCRCCTTYLQVLIKPEIMPQGAEPPTLQLAPGFRAPFPKDYGSMKEYIEASLPAESPIMYGMHPNAELSLLTSQVRWHAAAADNRHLCIIRRCCELRAQVVTSCIQRGQLRQGHILNVPLTAAAGRATCSHAACPFYALPGLQGETLFRTVIEVTGGGGGGGGGGSSEAAVRAALEDYKARLPEEINMVEVRHGCPAAVQRSGSLHLRQHALVSAAV